MATVVAPDRHDAALAAFRAGLMPLHSTGVDIAAQLQPTFDGRGVLIAILDSGIDPSVAGFERTSDGDPKLVDLRDFSGEGRVALHEMSLLGDARSSLDTMLGGTARLTRLTADDVVWVGEVVESRFGDTPGADLSGDGTVDDTLRVVVARGRDGWFMMTDTDLDRHLDDENPYYDFAAAGDWFGWSADAAVAPRVALAVNLDDSLGVPRLNLAFDANGHGTHVAGIAAGNDLYGIQGFDGVAPGAQLLGLKIAANGLGGVTTSGSLLAAMAYAIRYAEQRQLPLVINLSFGIGNPQVGSATLDRLVDSILTEHPRVVMAVAVGNDGPGLGTIGVPASASKVIAVGATAPLVFAGMGPTSGVPDPVAHYSSRGGRRPGPDLLAPGRAWSSVPRYEAGREELSGTSMAAPHVAGLAARLLSLLDQRGRIADRRLVRQALTATAGSLPFATTLDQGAGEPDLVAAYRWLEANDHLPDLAARAEDGSTGGTLWVDREVLPARLLLRVTGHDEQGPVRLRLRSTVPWLAAPGGEVRPVPPDGALIALDVEPSTLLTPGVRSGTLLIEDADDEGLGVLLRVPVTVIRQMPLGGTVATLVAMQAGETAREVFDADSGRALRIEVETLSRDGLALVSLHEPDGQRVRDGSVVTAGYGPARVVIDVSGEDVQAGRYELDFVAPATVGVAARVMVRQSPVRVAATFDADRIVLAATNLMAHSIAVDLTAELVGAAVHRTVSERAAVPFRLPVAVPAWARSIVVDVEMAPAEWSRFTDFGVTVRDRRGRLLAKSPMTHAFGRLRLDLPPGIPGETVYVVLAPAFPRKGDRSGWRVDVRTEFRLAEPIPLVLGSSGGVALSSGERRTVAAAADFRAIGGATHLAAVVRVTSRETTGTTWQRELTLKAGEELSQ